MAASMKHNKKKPFFLDLSKDLILQYNFIRTTLFCLHEEQVSTVHAY